MSKKFKAIFYGSLLIAMLTIGLATVQAGGKKGNGGSGSPSHATQEVRGSNQDSTDPCLDGQSPCGNGDHGQGNPVNGSEHANCNAAQGEVDPVCEDVTPTPDPSGGES